MTTKHLLRRLEDEGFTVRQADLALVGPDVFDGFWAISDHRHTDIGHICHMLGGEYIVSWQVLPTITEEGDLTQVFGQCDGGAVLAITEKNVLDLFDARYRTVRETYAKSIAVRGVQQTQNQKRQSAPNKPGKSPLRRRQQ